MIRIIRMVVSVIAFSWANCAFAVPITAIDTVTVEGTKWVQVDLFTSLAWSDINTVCPSGVCGSGSLNGFDMAGWTWATTDEVKNLFNHYIGFPALGPGVDRYESEFETFLLAFYADGWRPTERSELFTMGRLADRETITAAVFRNPFNLPGYGRAIASTGFDGFPFPQTIGAFFHRSSSEIPAPAILPLFCLALVVLALIRGKLSYS
ncbi:Uncharacterised protein [Halioglobus japonicus]|nr:Uncharacterised protein [Halioglobus japonicus]